MSEKTWERQWPPELPYDYSAMTLEKALVIIDGAKKKAQEMKFAETIAVCDAAGNLVAIVRMDDCTLLSLEIAVNKARTAVLGKIPTHAWGTFFKGAVPEIAPLWFHTGWITFMGGFPIVIENIRRIDSNPSVYIEEALSFFNEQVEQLANIGKE